MNALRWAIAVLRGRLSTRPVQAALPLPRILKALEGAGVLTVSDIDGFAEKGGMIGISSRLPTLARVVPSR